MRGVGQIDGGIRWRMIIAIPNGVINWGPIYKKYYLTCFLLAKKENPKGSDVIVHYVY